MQQIRHKSRGRSSTSGQRLQAAVREAAGLTKQQAPSRRIRPGYFTCRAAARSPLGRQHGASSHLQYDIGKAA